MHSIWKTCLTVTDVQKITVPVGATILSCDVQNSVVCLWYAVSKAGVPVVESRTIRIIGTGHDIPDYDDLRFIGTVLTESGSLVWHVFEVQS